MLYKRVLCCWQVPQTPQQYSVLNHLGETRTLATFHYTNVSFTCLSPFLSIYFVCCEDWNERKCFLRMEEFSCKRTPHSLPLFVLCLPPSLLPITAFFSKKGAVSRKKIPQTNQERWKCSFRLICIHSFYSILLHLYCEGSLVWCALGRAYPWYVYQCHHLWWGHSKLKTCPWQKRAKQKPYLIYTLTIIRWQDFGKTKEKKILAVMQAAVSSESFSNPGLLCLLCVFLCAWVHLHLHLLPQIRDKILPYGFQSILYSARIHSHKHVVIVFVVIHVALEQ